MIEMDNDSIEGFQGIGYICSGQKHTIVALTAGPLNL
jgi:hypothetical protein